MVGPGDPTFSLRWSLRRLRRLLRPFRALFIIATGSLGTILSTVYDDLPRSLHITILVAMTVCTGVTVLLTESGQSGAEDSDSLHRYDLFDAQQLAGAAAAKDRYRVRGSMRRVLRRAVPRRLRRRAVPVLPPSDGLFRGRERELTELIDRHDRQRLLRDAVPRQVRRGRRGAVALSKASTGPVLLLVHGKPGVGKSALVEELARRLAGKYPDGQIFANLGTAGGARTPGEILKDFLVALGWSESEMPAAEVQRAQIFRSLVAKKRILFILDAARHADQVRHVLPSDAAAAVIVTSRRDLSVDPDLNIWSDSADSPSYLLDLPSADDALSIFRAASRTDDGVQPECAAWVVHLCGRLPAAIRSAGERVSQDGTDVCHVAGLLRAPRSRLDWLERPGRPVASLFQAEYDRLLIDEKTALAMLTLVPSATFTPWVLVSLMNVSQTQAEALIARLSAAQLLDNVGSDIPSSLARYSFHPLVRLFAKGYAAQLRPQRREAATARLMAAYRQVVACVIAFMDPTYAVSVPVVDGSISPAVIERIAHSPDTWVRHEYHNLLAVMADAAKRRDSALCWRIGTRLGGCVPDDVDLSATIRAYQHAIRAARIAGDRLGLVDVWLAKGTFLAAVERYEDAEEYFEQAALSSRLLGQDPTQNGRAAALRESAANRKAGEAMLLAGSYGQATDAFEEALQLAVTAGDSDEQQLIRLLIAEANRVDSPEATYDQVLSDQVADLNRYRLYLSLADAARRRGDWQSARDHLDKALTFANEDLYRIANLQYRTARLSLDEYQQQRKVPTNSHGEPSAVAAIRGAAAAAVTMRRMGNRVGLLRAHCLLARALLQGGHVVEASQVLETAEQEIESLDRSADLALAPLKAQISRAKGELLMVTGELQEARRLLMAAATAFGEHDDWAAQTDMMRKLSSTYRTLTSRPAADDSRTRPVSGTEPSVDGRRRGSRSAGGPHVTHAASVPRQRRTP